MYIEVKTAALTTGHWGPSPSFAPANIQELVDDTALIFGVLHQQVSVASNCHEQIARSVPVAFLNHVAVAAQRHAIQPTSCLSHVARTQRVEQVSPTEGTHSVEQAPCARPGESGKRPGMVSALQTRINLGFVEAPCCLRDLRGAEFLQPQSHVILHPQTDANMR